MLSDREKRELRGIESELAESAPGLERRMRVHAFDSTPHEPTPRLPVVLLVLGGATMLATAFAPTTIAGCVLLAIATVTLLGYALSSFPVHPFPRLNGLDEEAGDDGDLTCP